WNGLCRYFSPGWRSRRFSISCGEFAGVNELQAEVYSPPCITARRGGCAVKIRSREATLFRADGVVFLIGLAFAPLNRKTTPASQSADASRNLFNRSATPPCGDARRGMTPDSTFVHTFLSRRLRFRIPAAAGSGMSARRSAYS